MAVEVVMPRLGWTMEKGSLVEWHKKDGEAVEEGEALFSVESDKAVQEVEALESGILRIPPDSPPPGREVPVGTLLAYVLQPGEKLPAAAAGGEGEEGAAPGPIAAADAAPTPSAERLEPAAESAPAISPRARRVARELGVEWQTLRGSGRTGRIVERDVRRAAAEAERAAGRATPLARRVATDLEVDIDRLMAERPGERIRRADVEAAAAASAGPGKLVGESRPVTSMRRTIAERMAAGAHTTAAVTLTTEADATALVQLREELKATLGPRGRAVPSYNDLLVKLTAHALQEFPDLNASWGEDEIIVWPEVHIALAVDTEAGLLVPVIRDVPHKSIERIAEESRAMIERARARRLGADELTGGTFTITNLGMYNIDAFTPIINLPQCAILGVGRIVKKPAEWQDRLVLRHRVALSLTFDHRVVDGGPAARFLDAIREYVEHPYLWLVR